jgi:hypothetical protein
VRIDWALGVLLWLFGLVCVVFPAHVLGFYRWFHGHDEIHLQQTEPRHVRNAGVLWLLLMAAVTYFDWAR